MNYLINESPLLVLPTLACMIGLNEAIVTQQIHYWLGISKNEIDGKKWVFNTYQDWQKQFPWWSLDTVKRTFRSLEKLGVLETDNYNKMNIDRTKWYTINYQRLEEIAEECKMPSWTMQNALMDDAKCPHGWGQNAPTNNHILPNTTSDTTTVSSPDGDYPPDFLAFWDKYPRKVGKGQAYKAFQKIEDTSLIEEALNNYLDTLAEDTNKTYIKHPSTFLNNLKDYLEISTLPLFSQNYKQLIGKYSQVIDKEARSLIDRGLDEKLLLVALAVAKQTGKSVGWRYIKAIAERWLKDGITTLADYEAREGVRFAQ